MHPDATRTPAIGPTGIATLIALTLAAVTGVAWYLHQGTESPTAVAEKAAAPAPAAKPAEPPHFPVPAPAGEPPGPSPLPPLESSDGALAASLSGLLGKDALARLLRPESLVRRLVATVDNLPRKAYSQRLSPAQPVGGLLAVTGRDESLAISSTNAARYAPWVDFARRVDTRRAVAIYAHYYPLFQQAYVELGYPDGYFNNRLVQVIDHLLEAPVPKEPPKLVVRHVLYEFADPDLESQSAGRKILLRMGPENAAVVKAKLREIRAELTGRARG